MALKGKKGHFLVSKTQKTKLTLSQLDWLKATRQLFNQVVEFYVLVYQTHPELGEVPNNEVYSVIEPLTIVNKQRPSVPYPLPYNCPQLFRRAAIKKALGIFISWQTTYKKWQKKCQKLKSKNQRNVEFPKPPILPREYNCSPSYYKGMYGERVSRRIIDFAHKYGATVIVFEHLTNLKPSRAKYSRRSNQKRAYWLKSKVYRRSKEKALNDCGASYVNKAINNPIPTLKGMVRACCPLPFPKSSKF